MLPTYNVGRATEGHVARVANVGLGVVRVLPVVADLVPVVSGEMVFEAFLETKPRG